MTKKYSWKFWSIFWCLASMLLLAWYVFLQIKNGNIEKLRPLVNILPMETQKRNEIRALLDIYNQAGGFQVEKNFLVLFQNNLELRPGGGFIGAFAVMKMEEGKIANIQVFDTGIFDKSISDNQAPQLPFSSDAKLPLLVGKMRDSNWSPDFRENAKEAKRFYQLGTKKDNIDGVVAINTDVLNSILALTGPVAIEGYPGEYRDENAILQLEYQVEKGYIEQGIAKGERKNIMGELADTIKQKIHEFNISQQIALARKLEKHLNQKDIQIFFNDSALQSEIEKAGWSGQVEQTNGDYLLVVDANVNALKSDYCIKRKAEYEVDLTGNAPQAVLRLTYEHKCRARDWMTSDYRDWLRVYAPNGSEITGVDGQTGDVEITEELGKQVFGMLAGVPIGETKTIELKYTLPESVKTEYSLLVQKQSGSGELPIEISAKLPSGREKKIEETLTGDRQFDF